MASPGVEPRSGGPAWVPLRASEETWVALREALRHGATSLALCGPAGAGKSHLLRRLAAALRPAFRPVLIPFPVLPAGEVAAWALGLLNAAPQGDPEARLVAVAREGPGPVVLLLDEAEALPVATAQRLRRRLEEADGGLRLVVCCDDDPRVARVLDALGAPTARHLAPGVEPDQLDALLQAHGLAVPAAEVARLAADAPRGPAAVLALARAVARTAGEPVTVRRDPFALTADPDRDAPRPELAAAVESLAALLEEGAPACALSGPPGCGKTLGLRLLARRLAPSRRSVVLPYPALAPDEALGWLADLLDAPARGDGAARLRAALAADARPAVLMIDEAAALPAPTRARLLELAREVPALQLALAWNDAAPEPIDRALPQLPRRTLTAALGRAEAQALLRGRLAAAGPAVRAELFPPPVLRALHREAGHSPARLLKAADARLRRLHGIAAARPGARPGRFARSAARAAQGAAPEGAAQAPPPTRGSPVPAPARAPDATASRDRRPALALALVLLTAALFMPRVIAHEPQPTSPARADVAGRVPLRLVAPPGSRLLLDGRPLGVAPLDGLEVTPGPHRVRAVLPGGGRVERELRVGPGGATLHLTSDAADAR